MSARPELERISFAAATSALLPRIAHFLAEMGLPADDLDPDSLSGFELAFDGEGRIAGVAGIEVFGADALLRSVAVAPEWWGKGLGESLVARREAAARDEGVTAVYLLTTTARAFFRRLGYADVPRQDAPAAIAGHAQFRSLCPASATCLGKRL